jgi:hypothetical protein
VAHHQRGDVALPPFGLVEDPRGGVGVNQVGLDGRDRPLSVDEFMIADR